MISNDSMVLTYGAKFKKPLGWNEDASNAKLYVKMLFVGIDLVKCWYVWTSFQYSPLRDSNCSSLFM
ncbi:hypothetical protein PBCVCVM1_461L [Paramecium bursaria Chlorella virus CVM-1]|uniref:Uncharacterized protein m384L n=2 Tax=Paramecium bursaria Chlorella virus A1 TaxID=381899 RepID=A7IUB4_PBCVM|nr:hypothetical protein F8205_gp323 [Paramecium bursaria Chlorella virus CVA-1]ABT13938.1 hypothetical protein MT325_m384L [Paramecium bursaria chlorella virus MT325]AGE48821.1 hypothetical protein PBCVAP110A_457L [Paramecium bursaria Chlorella virus AP110A]AGE49832.1 hypothetical protein PBCVCan184_470L [Paramecium bursaria Chlorella virus Can18-4]AGE51849.1 hypothetical protein PBCVCVM1_461L [Paramecium bursaria Chlorella virus CVM-1]AGE52182.1 hypothetical protein PBCVCVR1_443L [Paramecium 